MLDFHAGASFFYPAEELAAPARLNNLIARTRAAPVHVRNARYVEIVQYKLDRHFLPISRDCGRSFRSSNVTSARYIVIAQ